MPNSEPTLSSEQQHALELCLDANNRIVGVTGGAGTGKTLILGHAYAGLSQHYPTVLVAPTGRAAKRIQELTGIHAMTIHRLLEFPMPEDRQENEDPTEPRRNRLRPIDQHIVFVDEASMLGPTLYRQLMDALPNRGSIRFFGDNNQLPPVEEGKAPFFDILDNQPSVTLTFNYRSQDAIVSNAMRVLRGSIPLKNERFEIIYCNDPIRTMINVADERFTDADHQIMTPTRRGNFGSIRINPTLQLKFNPRGPMLRLDRHDDKAAPLLVRAKDKFLWTKNDYGLSLFNGETGVIEAVQEDDGSLDLVTSDGTTHVPPIMSTYNPYLGHKVHYDPRKNLDLGYVITTHKAQGSEFHTIIYCITGGHFVMLNRRNFYTAITRAKERVLVICTNRSMSLSMRPAR